MAPALIEELETTVAAVGASVGASVVRIGRGGGRGAGVVIAEGKVLTNAHNLRGEETTVTFADGRSAVGTVSGVDADGDLAMLSVDTGGTQPIRWEPADVDPRVGAAVFAVANPAGRGQRVTFGLISAVGQAFRGPHGRRIAGSIEHTAPLNRGSSGGPVVDATGALVGINTNRVGDGFYLALPADADLAARITSLGEGQSPQRPRLGVALAPAHAARKLRAAVGLPPRDGLLIRAVEEGGPADQAGLAQGDLLVRAGDRELTSIDDLFDALTTPGPVILGVVRGADELTVTVQLG